MRNPRRVLSKAQILDRVWNYDFGGQANVVELYISYLRKKIDANRAPMIHTMRGAGYVLRPASLMSASVEALDSPVPPPSGRGTLARQLVLRVVALVALIAVLLSLFTALATRTLLMGQLDEQLDAAKGRVMMGDIGLANGGPGQAPRGIELPGQSVGTLSLLYLEGQTPRASVLKDYGRRAKPTWTSQQTAEQLAALPSGGPPTTVDIAELGRYRYVSWTDDDGVTWGVGLPLERGGRPAGQLDRGGDRAVGGGRRRSSPDRPDPGRAQSASTQPGRRDRPAGVPADAGPRRGRAGCPGSAGGHATRSRRSAASGWPSTTCSTTSRRRWPLGRRARRRCASSWPTRRTSCVTRWPPSAATPSSPSAAARRSRPTRRTRCRGWSRRPSGCRSSSRTCCCWPGWTPGRPSTSSPPT